MDVDGRAEQPDEGTTSGPGMSPRPTHPWPASIALISGVVVLLLVLAALSTFR
jgi:hypothetical protein